MDKKDLIEHSKQYFESYGTAEQFHFTSDGTPFAEDFQAKSHAGTLENKTITTIKREDLDLASAKSVKTDEQKALEAAQKLTTLRDEYKALFDKDADDTKTAQQLQAAITGKKTALAKAAEKEKTAGATE